ncbi:MAG: helix-turn-helix domain-containing protein, partial [Woeseiaceae bacterium]
MNAVVGILECLPLRIAQYDLHIVFPEQVFRAAEALSLSYSAVSLQVRKRSEAIGMPLHEVIGRQLYLTGQAARSWHRERK